MSGVLGQSISSSILVDEIDEICYENSKWNYITVDNKVVLTYTGNFTTNTVFGPRAVTKKELNKPNANSISFEFEMSDGWVDSIYTQTKSNNASAIQTLKRQYINHYDSIGWPSKHSQSVFENDPMKYLERFNEKSEDIFSSIIRLPDFRLKECGVWIKPSLDFSTYYIVQFAVREEIHEMITRIASLDIYVRNSLDNRNNY